MTYSIKSLIENLLSELGKNDIQYKGKISKFLVDNNWFNIEIDLDNYSISDKEAQLLIEKITNYLLGPTGLAGIQPIFKQKFPLTYKYFQQYSEDSNLACFLTFLSFNIGDFINQFFSCLIRNLSIT